MGTPIKYHTDEERRAAKNARCRARRRRKLGIPEDAVIVRAAMWTDAQLATLRAQWRQLHAAEIASLVGKSTKAVRGKASDLGLGKGVRLSSVAQRPQKYASAAERAAAKNARVQAAYRRARGLPENAVLTRTDLWTWDQVRVLREQWGCSTAAEISAAIGRTPRAVREKAREFGLGPALRVSARLRRAAEPRAPFHDPRCAHNKKPGALWLKAFGGWA